MHAAVGRDSGSQWRRWGWSTVLAARGFQAAEWHLQLFAIVRKREAFISKAVSRFPTNSLESPHVLLVLKWE